MKKLRWTMEGEFREVDMSTPVTLEGESKGVGFGASRGTRLSRPKQIDFFQRFMWAPFIPCFSPLTHGFSLQRVLTLPFTHTWFCTLLGQFNLQQFVSSLQHKHKEERSQSTSMWRHLANKSLYALGFSSELSPTPNDTFLFSFDTYGASNTPSRRKAIFNHQFPNHDLTLEALSPALYVDKLGRYWDVPLSLVLHLASLPSHTAPSYHLCLHHNSGFPTLIQGDSSVPSPHSLLPGTSLRATLSLERTLQIWRSKAPKLKMVQPYDTFLSNPHVSVSAIIGTAMTTCLGDSSVRSSVMADSQAGKAFCLDVPALNSTIQADTFSSVSFTAHFGNFQRLLLDLTRCHVRLDFPSGSKIISGAAQLAQDFSNSRQPSMEVVQAICPTATISFQQQIAGPFSFRVDSGVAVDLKKKERQLYLRDPVLAVEYALQVLGSAKAIAWYSPKQQEFMVELRFFET